MSEQEVEELDVNDGSVWEDETNNDTGEDNWTPDKASHNKSNFKKLSQKAKDAESRAEKAEREKAELEEELSAWRSENPDIVKETLSKKSWSSDKWELALFLVQNPDAKDALKEVQEFAKKGFDLETAWKYVKPTIAKESVDSNDFSIKWKPKTTKTLESMTLEEAYAPWALTKEQKYKWIELHPEQ